ncbi:LytR C-terminal domain-containing protein [Brevibacterium album]|uniref:LytR C-terminal domain-containing protein n=1 Tax=Brevibacterium album TaxID=417948 RepID=UPI00041C97CF|nr:LytR C-terminal domain-containing protein [Brevibacterium album]
MPTYPEDEFDRIAPTGRRGAHRREAEPGQRGAYVIIAVVAVIAVLLVVAVVNIIRTSFSNPEENVAEPPAASEPAEPGGEEDAEVPGEEATDEASAEVDKTTVTVGIYNGSGVNGAGAAFGEAASAQGWSVDDVVTYSTPDSTSTVFYSAPEYEAQAAVLAEELGIESIEESAEFPQDITAVIASDIAEQGPPAVTNE